MTEYRIFSQMLKKAGVVFYEVETTAGRIITIPASVGPRNEGYEGLTGTFRFTHGGALESVGSWDNTIVDGVA